MLTRAAATIVEPALMSEYLSVKSEGAGATVSAAITERLNTRCRLAAVLSTWGYSRCATSDLLCANCIRRNVSETTGVVTERFANGDLPAGHVVTLDFDARFV